VQQSLEDRLYELYCVVNQLVLCFRYQRTVVDNPCTLFSLTICFRRGIFDPEKGLEGCSMELTLEEKEERVRGFRPIDDVFFEVLASNRGVCEEILRTIMEDDSLVVMDVIVQSSERNLYGRSIRLDALCTLGNGELVNIEVQRSDDDDHLKRARFNASLITVKESQTGEKFSSIAEVYIVYISEFDFLEDGKPAYHIDKVVRETGKVVDDGLHEIFVNTVNHDGSRISELMSCFTKEEVHHPSFPKLSEEVTRLKHTEGGLRSVCKVMQHYEDIAKAEAVKDAMVSLVKKGLLSVEDAAAEARLPVEELKRLLTVQS